MSATLRHLLVLCVLLPSTSAFAAWQESLPNARLVGSGELRLFGFRIYSAQLWSPTVPLQDDAAFALHLTYHRTLSREDLVSASLKEIRRLNGNSLSDVQLQRWQAEMRRAFVDVEPNAQITGVYLRDQGARFYAGPQLLHEIADPEFARAFFAIWLDPRTRNPELRSRLLGGMRT